MTVELTAGSPGRQDGLGTPKKGITEHMLTVILYMFFRPYDSGANCWISWPTGRPQDTKERDH